MLLAHAVPLPAWPGGGRGGQAEAWANSPWHDARGSDLLPVEYYAGSHGDEVRDAVTAFDTDLLRPLLASPELAAAAPVDMDDTNSHPVIDAWRNRMPDPKLLMAVRRYLGSIRASLAGLRKPRAFQEAVQVWHRRVAAIAALRDEQQADRPGWPALCPVWTSACGTYQIVPLTSARDLVAEGKAHEHCVGTYYESCRSGRTHILSLRANGVPAVTAEILLEHNFSKLSVGQFKGYRNQIPDDPALQDTMRAFLRNIRGGAHPLNLRAVKDYCRQIDESACFHREHRPSLAHAREIFPLYLPLLPRSTPPDYDAWCAASGLKDGLLAAERLFAEALAANR